MNSTETQPKSSNQNSQLNQVLAKKIPGDSENSDQIRSSGHQNPTFSHSQPQLPKRESNPKKEIKI